MYIKIAKAVNLKSLYKSTVNTNIIKANPDCKFALNKYIKTRNKKPPMRNCEKYAQLESIETLTRSMEKNTSPPSATKSLGISLRKVLFIISKFDN